MIIDMTGGPATFAVLAGAVIAILWLACILLMVTGLADRAEKARRTGVTGQYEPPDHGYPGMGG